MIDALTALQLQIEWGADEALAEAPLDRFERPVRREPAPPMPTSVPSPPAGSLDALYAALQAFEGSALRATAMHTVRPDGNPHAGLVVIGDAPGSDDDRSGRAFSGPPGQVLDRVLGSIGLDRTHMLLTHLVPWRPPGNRPLSESEIQACLPFVHRLLALVRPKRLLLLGAAPVRALTGSTEPIRRLKGRLLQAVVADADLTVTAMALPPVEQWFRSATSKQELWSDLIQFRTW
ncbi:MAG: uracil-DNA glycosylase [Acetobacteraceae bacterium]|nr:uracil-DNA glycosylase [Acetobacteraceae bacterium]